MAIPRAPFEFEFDSEQRPYPFLKLPGSQKDSIAACLYQEQDQNITTNEANTPGSMHPCC